MLYNKQWEKPEVKKEWRKILLRAADVIECFGWVQGKSGNAFTGFCAIGALEYVTPDMADWPIGIVATHNLQNYINHDVADWNDSKLRTKQEVVEAMRAAAKQ